LRLLPRPLGIGSVATSSALFVGGSANSNVAWERYVSVGGQGGGARAHRVRVIAVQKINDEAEAVLATDDDDVIVVDRSSTRGRRSGRPDRRRRRRR